MPAQAMSERVAFVGLGVMGFPMAGHLQRAGHQVTVYNRTASRAGDWYQQFEMNYIDVPLLLRIGVNLRAVELFFNLGPYVGYAVSSKVKMRTYDEELGSWVKSEYSYEFDDFIEDRFDAGIVMGAGFRVLMVAFQVHYNTGLTHVANTKRFNSSNHKYLNVSLGVQF